MKIPKTLNIFSHKYKIIIEPDFFESENTPGQLLQGETDLNDKIIRIRKAENDIVFNTLLHEAIHAVCHEMELYKGEHDEELINRLTMGLIDTLVRNKMVRE